MGRAKTLTFKERFSLDERMQESQDIIAKYPDRLPEWHISQLGVVYSRWKQLLGANSLMWCVIYILEVVVEKYEKTDLPEMEKKKFLVPRDMSVGQFIHILSGRLHLAPGKALFVFVQNTLPQTSSLMEALYDAAKDEDGFLYMCYSSEKTFGGHPN